MARYITVGAAQSGPVSLSQSRSQVVDRLLDQMRQAHGCGCDVVVYTEVALTAFFPHWYIEDEAALDGYFESQMPSPLTQPLFDEAKRLGIGFHLGYAEVVQEGGHKRRYNTAILVDKAGEIIGKYRKIHLPGHAVHRPTNRYQNLEKLYFDPGDLGFNTWRSFGGVMGLCICYDRRWPETYRVLALKGAEMIFLGYNTPDQPDDREGVSHLANFHNTLCMQAGAYQNATWVVGVAKAGVEEGVSQIGQSCIIAPSGEIVAQAVTLEDELVVARCDLDMAAQYREHTFNFAQNRRIEHYGPIATQVGVKGPAG
jgi:N-carbamoyl-D-amino-acid hydrolase